MNIVKKTTAVRIELELSLQEAQAIACALRHAINATGSGCATLYGVEGRDYAALDNEFRAVLA